MLYRHEHVLIREYMSVQYVGGNLHLRAQAVTVGYFVQSKPSLPETAACSPLPIVKHIQWLTYIFNKSWFYSFSLCGRTKEECVFTLLALVWILVYALYAFSSLYGSFPYSLAMSSYDVCYVDSSQITLFLWFLEFSCRTNVCTTFW